MGKALAVSNVLLAASIGGGGGLPAGAGVPPGNVTGIIVNSAYVDPVSLEMTLSISFTPPTGGTYTGVHIWLEIPDQSSGATTTATVGTTAVGTSTVAGPWAPLDLGLFLAPNQPWTIQAIFPRSTSLNALVNTPCRLYLASYSSVVDNVLVRNGLAGATPNLAFTLVSLATGTGSAGTNVTVNCGQLTVTVLPNQNVSGKLVTPVLAIMGGVPSNPPKGWGYRVYICYGANDPTNPKNLTQLTGTETAAGVIPAPSGGDGVTLLNSFVIATPTTTTQATLWALSGLTINGAFTPNALVVGITSSCPITLGTNTGTIDASQTLLSSIEAQFQVVLGKFGITPGSLNANTYLVAGTIVGGLLAATNIITVSGQIGNLVVADASIASCNVSKLLAGTATFTGTAVFQNAGSTGPQLSITSSSIGIIGGVVAGSSFSLNISNTGGITISSTATGVPMMALTASALTMSAYNTSTTLTNSITVTPTSIVLSNGAATPSTVTVNSGGISMTQGLYSLSIAASSINLQYNSGYPQVNLYSNQLYISQSANDYIQITSGTIYIWSGSQLTYITGNQLYVTNCQVNGTLSMSTVDWSTGPSIIATAGAKTLPSAAAGYIAVTVNGVSGCIPWYNV